jgi:hypothetical protein
MYGKICGTRLVYDECNVGRIWARRGRCCVSLYIVVTSLDKGITIQGYSRETYDENPAICNPKYKKPLELDILFNSSNPSSLANKINHDTFSLLRLWAKVNNGWLLKFSLRVGYGSFFVFRSTLDTDKFDISINVFYNS